MGREILTALALFGFAASPAMAMDMAVDGPFQTVTLSGKVEEGDCDRLTDVLTNNPAIRLVVLKDSTGGNAASGYCIGARIRKRNLHTTIDGYCLSSCSRMWLGGVERTLRTQTSHVGLHANYNDDGTIMPSSTQTLRTWLPEYAPDIDRGLMERWTELPTNRWMMNFYNTRAELCEGRECKPVDGRNARNAGLATR
jgi:hypothetical protein